jgi:hypothetical protein
MKRYIIEIMGLLLLIGSASAMAVAMDGPPGHGGTMGPPPEAIEACKDKNERDKVEITNSHGEKMKTICKQIDGQLVAVPEGDFRGPKVPPPGERHGGE